MKQQNLINKDNLPSWKYFCTTNNYDNYITLSSIENITLFNDINKITNVYGFVYKLTYTDNTFYIGKKNFYKYKELPVSNRKTNRITIGEPFKKRYKGKLVLFETVQTETNWLNYTGSHEFIEPKELKSREILEIAYSKLHLTFLENKYLYNNILNKGCLNQQISDKIYRDRLKDDIIKQIGENRFNWLYGYGE